MFTVNAAHAQSTVNIRSGSHENYSRLVFDWPQKTGFNVEKTDERTLQITFKSAAKLNAAKINAAKMRNISAFDILAQDPAKVTITIPRTSKHRSFHAGSKVVLDIYNPTEPEPAEPAPDEIAQRSVSESSSAPPSEETLEPAQEPAQQDESEDFKNVLAANVEPVEQEPLFKIEAKNSGKPNLIAISSSKAVGLAVFERGENLWIVNDKEDLLLHPQISGPDADQIRPLLSTELTGAKAYTTRTLANYHTRTQGGGLIWKIIVSQEKQKAKSIEPIRKDIKDDKARSGRMIWPLSEPGEVIDITDPVTGKILKVITAKSAKDFIGQGRNFVDFNVLPSAAGLVIEPKVDDLMVRIISTGVEISRPAGLAILSPKIIATNTRNQKPIAARKTGAKSPQTTRVFDFKNWQLGGVEALKDNKSIILSDLKSQPKNARDEGLMTLAKMYLSNAMGAEALGFLAIIAGNNPELSKTPEFRAIRGAARAIDEKTEAAFSDLSTKSLAPFDEIGFWKAYALADLGDWQQAINVMPKTADVLYDYPKLILNRLGLVNVEVALRAGNVAMADEILTMIEDNKKVLTQPQQAALQYLKGESARQKGDIESTKTYWEPLITGPDDLYRAKAGLAHTRLLVDKGELKPGKAIDNLERLRYSWRGDELESQINYWLGRTYFEARQFVKGLNIMREAASFAATTRFGRRVTNEMGDIFTSLFLGDELENVSPLDAVALYEQFSELIPVGDEGNKIVERLADRLAQADLLDRAGNLLNYQVTHRLKGLEVYDVGVKLAAIRLLDDKPDDAMTALNTASQTLETLPEELKTPERYQAIALLRARAFSRQDRPDQALALLEELTPNPTIHRLSTDIAWTAGYWDDAGIALKNVILDENISLTRPLSEEHSSLILRRAVALNLASDRIALANMREKYADAMAGTEKARIFDVITRPRQNAALADRETLLSIVDEVDLFENFLNSYKTATEPVN